MMKKWLSYLFGRTRRRSEWFEMTPPTAAALPVEPAVHAADRAEVDADALFYPWLLDVNIDVDADADADGDVDGHGGGEANEAENRFLRALERMSATDNSAVTELVPRMPAVIPVLLQSLHDKNISNTQLAEQISRDPVLVAAVIRQANSSYYRRTMAVTSIEQALTILGSRGLRLVVASVAFKPLINVQSGHFTKLAAPRISELSNRCAIACRSLGAQRQIDPFEPFLAALVQNVGVIVALRVMDQVYDGKGLPHSLAFCTSFARYARLLSCRIASEWEFPETVTRAIRDELVSDTPASMSALGQVLYLADKLSKIRMMVNSGHLREEDVEEWLAGDDMRDCAQCYREVVASESGTTDQAQE
jgi:HD-like signal output (HDOD) protein